MRLVGFVKAKQGPRVRQCQQQLVAGSTAVVCAVRVTINGLCQSGNCFLKTEELLCNRKDLQQLVTRSAGAVRAVWGAIGKAFQLKYAVKEYFIRQKNKRAFLLLRYVRR